jgi:hypothetical protein
MDTVIGYVEIIAVIKPNSGNIGFIVIYGNKVIGNYSVLFSFLGIH